MPAFKAVLMKTNREKFQNVTKCQIEYDLKNRRAALVNERKIIVF